MKIIIPSKSRAFRVPALSQMFPTATWCVSVSERPLYALPDAQVLVHPDTVIGLPRKRQWILDHVPDETVVMVDDDVRDVWCQVGRHGRAMTDPLAITRILENSEGMAKGFGTSLFAFANLGDVRKVRTFRPFHLTSWVGGVIGIIGRKFSFTTRLRRRGDIDFTMQVLERDRITFVDTRFAFRHDTFSMLGGGAGLTSSESDTQEIAWLTSRWSPWLRFSYGKSGAVPRVLVTRQQHLSL